MTKKLEGTRAAVIAVRRLFVGSATRFLAIAISMDSATAIQAPTLDKHSEAAHVCLGPTDEHPITLPISFEHQLLKRGYPCLPLYGISSRILFGMRAVRPQSNMR